MDKEELLEKFEKNVAYLQKIVPPDDIYVFTEQTFMAALFFLKQWSKHVNIMEECEKDRKVTRKWVTNIMAFLHCREEDLEIVLNLDLEREVNEDNP